MSSDETKDTANSVSGNVTQEQEPKRGEVQRYAMRLDECGNANMRHANEGDYVLYSDHAANVAELEKTIEELHGEIHDLQGSLDLQSGLNERTAKALGKPSEGEGSSWHDMPECVADLRKQLAEANSQLAIRDRDLTAALDRIRDATDRIAKVFGDQIGHGLPIDGPGGCVQWVLTWYDRKVKDINGQLADATKERDEYVESCTHWSEKYVETSRQLAEAKAEIERWKSDRDMYKSQLAAEREKRERLREGIEDAMSALNEARLDRAWADLRSALMADDAGE